MIALPRSIFVPLVCFAALVFPLTANASHHKKHHKATAREVDLIAQAIAGATDQEPLLASSEVLVLDEESNDVLLSKNASQVRPMASITKLMTALVVLEADQPMDQSKDMRVTGGSRQPKLMINRAGRSRGRHLRKLTPRNLGHSHPLLFGGQQRVVATLQTVQIAGEPGVPARLDPSTLLRAGYERRSSLHPRSS